MDSQSEFCFLRSKSNSNVFAFSSDEEISSILDRFRRSLMNNEIESLLNEFRSYRENWSMNKFRMFLTNVLIVMRSWTNHVVKLNTSIDEENWDVNGDSTQRSSTIDDRMENSAFHLFVAMIDYLRWSKETNSMSVEVEFDIWKRIVTHRWTINEKVSIKRSFSIENFCFSYLVLHLFIRKSNQFTDTFDSNFAQRNVRFLCFGRSLVFRNENSSN